MQQSKIDQLRVINIWPYFFLHVWRNPLNQNFRAEVWKFLGVEWIATGPNGFIPFHSQNEFCAHLKWRMLDHCCSHKARWRFRRWYRWCCVRCFIHSNLTSITGYCEQIVPDIGHMTSNTTFESNDEIKRTFQVLLTIKINGKTRCFDRASVIIKRMVNT